MEHEDNAHLSNILQGSQHLMENLQMASGDSMCANVVDEIAGKFEEHEVHDDEEEWKYIKEGQQSEKHQQQMDAGIDCKDMVGVKDVGNGYEYDIEHGSVGADGLSLGDHEVDNGVGGMSAVSDANFINTAAGNEDTDIKNDGDFSTTSNTTSTNEEEVGRDVLQVEMKIESAAAEQLLAHHSEDLSGKGLTEEDDEQSSLTNGSNSLSENAAQEQIVQIQTGGNSVQDLSIEDKENADPLLINSVCSANTDTAERANEIDFEEMHSQLNPNATEFVPNFGSNPSSPMLPSSDDAKFLVGETAVDSDVEINVQPHPTAIPHYLLNDDDFVAQSPRKGSGESNFDGIAIPDQVIDFEHEAAKRPHELEHEDDLVAATTDQHSEQEPQILFDQYDNQIKETTSLKNEDFTDFRDHSPSSLIDHGPETCVDLDADVDMEINVSDKNVSQQVELSNEVINESIVDLLNTVQRLPIEDEELLLQESVAGKELLDVEEKENISNPPSTEEMQMNVQNELHSSIKDIPQIPIDMDNAAHMQESFYLESTSSLNQHNNEQIIDTDFEKPVTGFDNSNLNTEKYYGADHNTNMEEHTGLDEISFETMRAAEPSNALLEFDDRLGAEPAAFNLFNSECMPAQTEIGGDVITPSPISTEEKHLVEDTKEQAPINENLYELEQKMDSITLSKQDEILATKDEILSQVEEVAQTAANIVECMNPFSAPEPEQHKTVEQIPIEANHSFSTESQQHADFLQQNHEQLYDNERMEQNQTAQEMESESLFAHHANDLLLTQPINQPIASPTKMEFELNGFDNSAPAMSSIEDNVIAPATENNVFVPSAELSFNLTTVSQPEELAVASETQQLLSEPENSSQQEVMHVLETESQPALELSSDIISNLSTVDEPLLVAAEIPVSIAADETVAPIIDSTKSVMSNELLTAAVGVGAIAATTAALTVAANDDKKPDIKKPRTPTSTKAKAPLDAKKATEPIKKPLGTTAKTTAPTTTTARPRTAPAKATTLTEKKSSTITSTVAKSSTSTATRKPLTSTVSTTKTITKTTTARPTTAPAAPKPATARTSTTARRSAPTTTTGGPSTASNGIAANAKPKQISGAPTKPTTLGLSTTTKPKLSSPRTTLTSQLRKTAPPTTTGIGATTARSPLKTTAQTTNGISKSLANTTAASRAKSSTSSITTTTKTFTARPAPKTTHSTTTTRRTVSGVQSTTSTTGPKTTTGATLQKKIPPGSNTRVTTTTSGKSSLSPNKTSSATLKVKAKDVPKKAITPTKTTNDIKAKPIKRPPQLNGIAASAEATGDQLTENKTQLNGKGDGHQLEQFENGIHHVELENGEGGILEQQAPALIDA